MNHVATPQTCRNIAGDGVRFRMFFGVLMVFFALGMTLLLAVAGMPLPVRATVFIPLWLGILCLLQAHRGVCVFLAARGLYSVEGGNALIEDPGKRKQLMRQGTRIHLLSMSGAWLLTIVLMMASLYIPWRSFFVAG